MSLTFDYVTMPPKSQEASQIQTNEISRIHQENQQLESQFQEHVKKNSEQTIRRNKAENEELKNEERNRQNKQKKKQNFSGNERKSNNSSSRKSEKEGTIQDNHFDMRI